MAVLDWSQCPAVESVSGKVGGAWLFKGTRPPVATVIENLEDLSIEEVIEQFDVTRECRIALVVLTGGTKWSRLRQHVGRIAAVASAKPGSYSDVEIPFEPKPGRA